MLFDSGYSTTNYKLFKKYDWFDFCWDSEDSIPPNMPEARGHGVPVTFVVFANHGGDLKNWKRQTGVLIFINKAPIHRYIK